MTLLSVLARQHSAFAREELLAAVLCGDVQVNGAVVRDPRLRLPSGAAVTLEPQQRHASRGAIKLQQALDAFCVDVSGLAVLDAGAATGGFTDCLLSNGARLVFSVDVAYGMLSYSLRQDPRTVVLERTNAMHLAGTQLQPRPDLAVCDLSFRSLRGAATHLLDLTERQCLIALAKPQFEWLDPPPTFAGVVAIDADVAAILQDLFADLERERVAVRACVRSPILGRRGNREAFLLLARLGAAEATPWGEQAQPPTQFLAELRARADAV